jgi:predicted DNA-binding protein (UPF0251 family)/predicted Fe-Mo cluster-binding NifX family protein
VIELGLDEIEAIRLADLEGLYQEAAARSMGVSRQTFGRIIEKARRKVAQALIERKALRVAGQSPIKLKETTMSKKIAVPAKATEGTEHLIDEHFGHCAYYIVYETEGNSVVSEHRVESPAGCGCKSNIAGVLAHDGVSLMLAGNMGDGAVRVLAAQGIAVVRGLTGDTRQAVQDWLDGKIRDSGQSCSEHEEGHQCSQ